MEKVIVDKYKKEVTDVLKKVSNGLAESVIDKTNIKSEKLLADISILNDLIKKDLSNNENFYNNLKRNSVNAHSKISDIEVSVNLSKSYLEDSFQNFSSILMNIDGIKNKLEILSNFNRETSDEMLKVTDMLERVNQNITKEEDINLMVRNQQNIIKLNYILMILFIFVLISTYMF